MEKKEKRKKSSFFRISLFAGLISGRGEPGRNKTSAPLSSRTHFHLFGSAPIFPRGVFSRPPNPCRSPCLGPTPSTDEKRHLKYDKPGIPTIGSRVALAFHSGYRRPQNCFSVCTKGKTLFQFCESDEIHQDRQERFKFLTYATGKTKPASPTPLPPSLPPPPASPPHTPPMPTQHSYPSLLPWSCISSHTPNHHHHSHPLRPSKH